MAPPRQLTGAVALNAALLLLLPSTTSAILLSVAVLPHGDFAADPTLLPPGSKARARAQLIHAGAVGLGVTLAASAPDGILLITPHGIALSRDFNLYLSSNGSGFAAVGGDLHNATAPIINVPMAFPLDTDTTASLLAALGAAGENATGMLPFADSEPVALRWGEIIPLSFLAPLLNNSVVPRVSVWAQPLRRYNYSSAPGGMTAELLRVGGLVGRVLHASPKRYISIISVDLSHVHSNPYVEPYGANDTAAGTFDGAVGAWLASGDDSSLVGLASDVSPWAMSCGITGMVVGAGMVRGVGGAWVPSLLAGPLAPTYYGMVVGRLTRGEEEFNS